MTVLSNFLGSGATSKTLRHSTAVCTKRYKLHHASARLIEQYSLWILSSWPWLLNYNCSDRTVFRWHDFFFTLDPFNIKSNIGVVRAQFWLLNSNYVMQERGRVASNQLFVHFHCTRPWMGASARCAGAGDPVPPFAASDARYWPTGGLARGLLLFLSDSTRDARGCNL